MFDKFDAEYVDGKVHLELNETLEWALYQALCYDFGRHTATTGAVATALIDFVADMTDNMLIVMYQGIENFLGERDRFIEANDGKPSSIEIFEHDVQPNIDLKSAIKQELKRRHKLNEL